MTAETFTKVGTWRKPKFARTIRVLLTSPKNHMQLVFEAADLPDEVTVVPELGMFGIFARLYTTPATICVISEREKYEVDAPGAQAFAHPEDDRLGTCAVHGTVHGRRESCKGTWVPLSSGGGAQRDETVIAILRAKAIQSHGWCSYGVAISAAEAREYADLLEARYK